MSARNISTTRSSPGAVRPATPAVVCAATEDRAGVSLDSRIRRAGTQLAHLLARAGQ